MDESRYDEIQDRITYHPPTPEARKRHEGIRSMIGTMMRYVGRYVPEGREQSLVFTKLEEALFWANAGIARNHAGLEMAPEVGVPASGGAENLAPGPHPHAGKPGGPPATEVASGARDLCNRCGQPFTEHEGFSATVPLDRQFLRCVSVERPA